MEKEIINLQILFFRKVLSKSIDLQFKSDLILSITKALFYFEHYGEIKLRGNFFIASSIEESDGYNKQNNAFKLSFNKKSLVISSNHTFVESFGLHHESHQEVYYPIKNYSTKDTLLYLESWENNFLETMTEKFVIVENINWKKLNQ
jgi:hypothetical protein